MSGVVTSASKLSFVIPCYGSEKTISAVVSSIVATVGNKNPYEIICVNDGSPDGVYSVLERLAAENGHVKVVNLSRNFGQHNALMAGYRVVTGDIVVSLDDDGQTDPRFCYELVNALGDDVDVVYAKYLNKKHGRFRNFGTKMSKIMKVWLADWPKDITSTSYFAAKRFVIGEIVKYPNPYTFTTGLVARTTKKIANVEIEHFERMTGRSGYTFMKLLDLWLNGFTQFSVKPLRISTVVGVIVAVCGLLFSLVIVVRKFCNPNITLGYSSLMCVILFIGGMIMVMLGLIGEYIGRVYICMSKSPQYVVRNTINVDDEH
ncbi:MAG: glycosyltransferase family 2 protein [Treponema sp.]|nr:glycosyltransferase family 2 protein [Treponema sp.]